MKKIKKCQVCSSYTLEMEHCGKTTVSSHPPPYNPNDKYAVYRREKRC